MKKISWSLGILLSLLLVLILAATGWAKTTLVYGTTEKIKDLDPATSYEFHTAEIFYNIYPTLLAPVGDKLEIGPGLAESYTVSEDGLAYTFKLRPNLKFPDGAPLDAEAVKHSIDRVFQLQGPVSFLVTGYVDHVQTVGSDTVVFHLKKPAAIFPNLVAISCYAPVSPKQYPLDEARHFPEDLPAKKMAGLGPYQIVSFKRDQELVLAANPDSYAIKAKADRIVIRYFADATTMRLALERGELDFAFKTLNPADVADLSKSDKVRMVEVTSLFIRFMVFQTSTEPFNNPKIRQALVAAIDREAILKKVYLGQNSPLYSVIPRNMWSYTSAFKTALGDGNLAKVKELLEPLGYSGEKKLKVDLWYTPTHYGDSEVDLATMLKSQWEATGLMEVDVQSAEWAAYYDKWTNKQMPVYLLGFYPDYVDPDNYMFLLGSTEGGKVIGTDYSNPAWDEAMAEALSTNDRDKREEIYRTLQTQWPEEVPTAPIYQGSLYLFLQKNIAGESFTPSGGLIYYNLHKK